MKRVGIQELGERASELLSGNEALTIERQGHAVGVYLPVPTTPQHDDDSIVALRAAIAAALADSPLTQDELADLFDLRHPLP